MGIWLIVYGLHKEIRDEYLAWFEKQHIDEKLARAGYDWAAHYEAISTDSVESDTSTFIALFGSADSRTFFDPTPAQIKPHQSELTRTMIGYRENALSLIATEEWSQISEIHKDNAQDRQDVISSPMLRLGIFDESAEDQASVGWCAQTLFPHVMQSADVLIARKLVASSGNNRHLVIEEYGNTPTDNEAWLSIDAKVLHSQPILSKLRVSRVAIG